MGRLAEPPTIDAKLSLDGKTIRCGQCGEPLAYLIEPTTPGYAAAVPTYDHGYPLYLAAGYLKGGGLLWRKTDRAKGRRNHGHRRLMVDTVRVEGRAPAPGLVRLGLGAGSPVIGWDDPRSGVYHLVCWRTSTCGYVNVVNGRHSIAASLADG